MSTPAAVSADRPEALIERVQDLQARLDEAGDGPTHALADELVSAVVQLYGAGLERIVSRLFEEGGEGERVAGRLADDPLVATLLLIHDLHPVPLADRVHAALQSVRPYMESHGGNVELVSLEDGVLRLRLQGSCSDCSASSVTLELAIKQALEDAAPDLMALEVEGVAPQLTGVQLPMVDGDVASTGTELPVIQTGPGPSRPLAPIWLELPAADQPGPEGLKAITVAGQALVIADVEGTLLAYRDTCAGCSHPLRDGELVAGALSCAHCGRCYFLPRAGRSIDGDRLQLEPVPLLREQGLVKVALAT